MNEKNENKPQPPVKEFRFQNVKAAVFVREMEHGKFYNVAISRSYQLPPEKRENDQDNGWRETNNYSVIDLAAVQLAARLSSEWITAQISRDLE